MPNLSVLVNSKEESEKVMTDTLQQYIGKYLRKVRISILTEVSPKVKTKLEGDSKSSIKEFQKMLLSMARWSDSKVAREYSKYVKWCKNYGYKEQQLQSHFDNVVTLSSQIMLYKYKSNLNYEPSSMQVLFYKCLKRIARHYYENPRAVEHSKDSKIERDILASFVTTSLNSFIPLDTIFEIMQEEEEKNGTEFSYDFNKKSQVLDSSENNLEKGNERYRELVVEKESTRSHSREGGLRYLSSDDFNNEYYNSDDAVDNDKQNREEVKKEIDEVKHIKVPKLKSGYSKQKFNPPPKDVTFSD
jgi:hypothetical protein